MQRSPLMKQRTGLNFHKTYENMMRYFDFLFKDGFRVISFMRGDREENNWQITLMKDEFMIRLYAAQGKVGLAFTTLSLYENNLIFGLEDLVPDTNSDLGLAVDPEGFSQDEELQFKQMSSLLEKYFDEIAAHLERNEQAILQKISTGDAPAKTSGGRWTAARFSSLSI